MALKDVFVDELRDMYSAENQLVKSMPKLAKGVESSDLKELFKEHADVTKEQVQRLREAFEHLREKPTGKHCEGMEGVIKEGMEALEEDTEGASYDSGILGAALRTEYYEIAGYQACIGMAKALGEKDIVSLLKENLAEETEMVKRLQSVVKDIFKEAVKEEETEEPEPSKKSPKEKESERKSKQDEQEAAGETKKGQKPGKKGKRDPKASDTDGSLES